MCQNGINFKKRSGVPSMGQLTVDFLWDMLYDMFPLCGTAISQLSGEGNATYVKKIFMADFAG